MRLRSRRWVLALLVVGTSARAAEADPPWVADFHEVWNTIRQHFVDPDFGGVDWAGARSRYEPRVRRAETAEEAARQINAMLDELGTSHTRYYTDEDPAYFFLFDLFRDATSVAAAIPQRFERGEVGYTGIGVSTTRIDDAIFLDGVIDGGAADLAGLRVGDRVVSVDGQAWHPIRPFLGKRGRPVTLRVQRTPDPTSEVDVVVVPQWISPVSFYLEALKQSARLVERDGRSIAYVHVWSYAGRQNHDALRELLTSGMLAPADALVVDLRGGWGGASLDYLNLFNPRMPALRTIERDGKTVDQVPQWTKPVALLVDGSTRSGKELLAFGFKRYGYGPVVGTRTAGAVTAGGCHAVGSRGLLYFAIRQVLVDGERLEGAGVVPDVEVPFAIPFAGAHDPQLDRAIEVLLLDPRLQGARSERSARPSRAAPAGSHG